MTTMARQALRRPEKKIRGGRQLLRREMLCVLSFFNQVKFCRNGVDTTGSVMANDVFRHHQIAWT